MIAKAKTLNLETFGFYHLVKGGGCMWERWMPIKTMNLWQDNYLKNSFLGNRFILHTCYFWDNSFFLSKHPHGRKYLFVFFPLCFRKKERLQEIDKSRIFSLSSDLFYSWYSYFPSQKEMQEGLCMSVLQLSSWYCGS